jgi:GT2 family glycosyltransferase
MKNKPQISVIIVSYNVSEFLYQCLLSVIRATVNIECEIFVVDNASVDGSVQMIKKHYPQVSIIENSENVGFAAANNQAMKLTQGDFLVLLNPDTIVQEDTFSTMISFFENAKDAGIAGCKILNPDGSFSLDSRHSIPSPQTALWKMLGLNHLFPKSKVFGRYHMTFLDPNEISQVDAISGSFMMFRRDVYIELNGLDEDYFMYCEDIDFCYRASQSGWQTYYTPDTNIIHYKGESTKKNNIDYVINFNRSLYLFYKKNFHHHYVSFFRWFILLGVFFRGIVVYIKNFISANFALLADITLMNLIYILTFYIRYEIESRFTVHDLLNQYIFINFISTFIFIASAYFLELYGKYKLSLIQVFKTNLITFFLLSALTFFVKQMAFSRIVVVVAAFLSALFMISWRVIIRFMGNKSGNTFSNSFFQRKIVLVGSDNEARNMIKKMNLQIPADFVIKGIVSDSAEDIGNKIEGIPVVSDLEHIDEFIKLENIDEVIFSTHKFSYKKIMSTMTAIDNPDVEFKIVPEKLEVIIGKSSIEQISEYQLVDIELPLGKLFNKITKRSFDIICAFLVLIPALPVLFLFKLLPQKYKKKYTLYDIHGGNFSINQGRRSINSGLLNKILLLPFVLIGRISLVGSKIEMALNPESRPLFKPGLTSLSQINEFKELDVRDNERYDLYYIKNQNFWLDLEIIIKSMFR